MRLMHRIARSARLGKLTLIVTMGLVVSLAVVSPSALATSGEYAAFAQCPLGAPGLEGCLASRIESGEIKIGKVAVPIVNTQILQGGFGEAGEEGFMPFVGARNGETFTRTGQQVPGGLLGLARCKEISSFLQRIACQIVFENRVTAISAVPELAAPASTISLNEYLLLTGIAPGLVLPVKIKLENPLLGHECYIGSNTEPIVLQLTTGTTSPPAPNQPIKGALGPRTSRGGGRILVIKNNSLVDNSFAVPKATGCGGGLSFLIDPIIDTKLGLPSPAGENTAILNGTIEQTGSGAAEESGE